MVAHHQPGGPRPLPGAGQGDLSPEQGVLEPPDPVDDGLGEHHRVLDLRVEDAPEPAGEVLIEVDAATTCGTDVKMWRHGHRVLGPYPCAFGHETAGVRADTGERVLVSDSVACGTCPPCRSGRAP